MDKKIYTIALQDGLVVYLDKAWNNKNCFSVAGFDNQLRHFTYSYSQTLQNGLEISAKRLSKTQRKMNMEIGIISMVKSVRILSSVIIIFSVVAIISINMIKINHDYDSSVRSLNKELNKLSEIVAYLLENDIQSRK